MASFFRRGAEIPEASGRRQRIVSYIVEILLATVIYNAEFHQSVFEIRGNKEHNGPLSHQVHSPVFVPIGQVIIEIEFILLYTNILFFAYYSLVKIFVKLLKNKERKNRSISIRFRLNGIVLTIISRLGRARKQNYFSTLLFRESESIDGEDVYRGGKKEIIHD